MTKKERNIQINKEAKFTVLLYILFFVWWFVTGYGFSKGDPSQFTYVMGLPMWFFLSCVVGWLLATAGVIFLVKKVFKDVPFDDEALEEDK